MNQGFNWLKEAKVSKYSNSRSGTITLNSPHAPSDEIRALAVPGQDIVFLGWQKTLSGDIYPLYNILIIGHPLYLSTVTEKTLQAQHLRIPRTPSPYPGVAPSPWHNPGNELVNPATAREAIEAAGLNFTVVKKPMKEFVELNDAADVSDRWVTVRTDTGEVLGIVGDSYEPIQNVDAFTFFDNLVGTDEAIYETAGTLGRGERTWIMAKFPGFINVRGKDIVKKCLLLSNCHDGSSLVRAKLTPIRAVCNNTLTGVLNGAGEITIRHTANAAEDMKQALSLLESTNARYGELDAVFDRMALTNISEKQLVDYVKALVPDKEDGEDNKENQEIRDAFLELHETGLGADLSRGTLWGAFNCVTEYADHGKESNQGTRLESIWFGPGEQLKQRAFRLAERMM